MKKFKRFLSLALAVLCIPVFASGCSSSSAASSSASTTASGDTLAQIKKRGVLVVGSSNDAPFAYIDTNTREFSGIDAEIITEAAKRLGIPKVQMKQISFENLLIELNSGKIDMVTDAMYIKPERQKIVSFTNIWYKEGEAIVITKDSPIKSSADLKDKVIGGQKGTAFLETANSWKAKGKVKDVKIFGSQSDLLLAVKTGKIDACITDGIVAAYSISKDKSLNLKILSPYQSESAGKIAAAVRKGDTKLEDAVNQEIDAMKNDGTILKILKKYGANEDYTVSVADGHLKA